MKVMIEFRQKPDEYFNEKLNKQIVSREDSRYIFETDNPVLTQNYLLIRQTCYIGKIRYFKQTAIERRNIIKYVILNSSNYTH